MLDRDGVTMISSRGDRFPLRDSKAAVNEDDGALSVKKQRQAAGNYLSIITDADLSQARKL